MKKALIIGLIILLVLVLVVVATFAAGYIRYLKRPKSYKGEVVSLTVGDKINDIRENFDPADLGLTLAWSDDFEGDKLDPTKWEPCPNYERSDGGAKWEDEMVELDGKGNLILKVGLNKEGKIASSGVRTMSKDHRTVLFEQAKGYFEIRTTLQNVPGYWSAFWLMSGAVNNIGNGASDGAEIDIFESFDLKGGRINHAIHWDGYGEEGRGLGRESTHPEVYDGKFHTFGLLWADDGYFFYIDGNLVESIDTSWANFPGSCQEPSYLKITTEVGTWAGYMLKSYLPDQIKVDYVKVYK